MVWKGSYWQQSSLEATVTTRARAIVPEIQFDYDSSRRGLLMARGDGTVVKGSN